ncbi:ATP-dependent helicase HrpB [Acidocella sp.]|uniref:ATP-dependent helicase HrpB n=1 Tax=Acidocella sp. TaxID=50710 RepID=UPI0026311246|nr:ATP-dependent helicase HrpB [Acidocella sp.]
MTKLPVHEILPELLDILRKEGGNAVLAAPPGTGKTTLVPLAALEAGLGKILVLEPRRLAARAAAMRMAELLGEPVGGRVGFRTRLESAAGPQTRIEVITEGLLTARLLADPGLTGINLVIFDEVHERSLEADLALALTRDLQRGLRPELRILAMSATADTRVFASLLAAPVLESQGRVHPVEQIHARRDIASPRDLPETAAKAVREAVSAHEGDILVFLPGMAEIRRTAQALASCPCLVLPLHGDLPREAQDLALREHRERRVVLSTSIAETSLTVPGVRIVIDGGYRRAPALDPSSGLTRLVTRRISRAAAAQRAGRAGRLGPGVAIRLWTEALHRGLPPFDPPEITADELSGLALACAAWGEEPAALPFPEPPPAGALKAAQALLRELGALDMAGRITPLGREMARLRAAPRLAAMMLAAPDAPTRALAADIAALLEDRDVLPPGASAELQLRLDALAGKSAGDRAVLARVRQAARLYRQRLGLGALPAAGSPGPVVAAGFPDRIAQARGEPGSYRLSGGGSGHLSPADPLARSRLLAVASLDGRGAQIRLGAALDAENLPGFLRARCQTTRETGFDPVSGAVHVRERVRLGTLVLSDRHAPPAPEEIQTTLARALSTRLDQLEWSEAAEALCARVAVMRGLDQDYPDLSRAALAATVQDWLAPYLAGMTNLKDVKQLDLYPILRARLTPAQAARLDRDLPAELPLKKGRVRIDYSGPVPVAAARAHMYYGTDAIPALAGGRVPLQIALLSPAGRPIAITADLAGFWRGGWADARRDMRGRYPKHDWPEEPWRS